LFCVHHAPQRELRACVVHVPALAEEMNKSRRAVAEQARALARMGVAVLQLDLFGCGDSDGDFSEARWDIWVNDVRRACEWLSSTYGPHSTQPSLPLWLWGLRAGCLVAADAARTLQYDCNFLFWHPVVSGKLHLQQLLRLRTVGDVAASRERISAASIRAQFSRGESVNLGGYLFPAALARALEGATLLPPPLAGSSRLAWLEVGVPAAGTLLPASEGIVAKWRASGYTVVTRTVVGPSFWQTVEIEPAPALVRATCEAIDASLPASLRAEPAAGEVGR
jgi:exosortase A-associated hydrolase 2